MDGWIKGKTETESVEGSNFDINKIACRGKRELK